MIVDLLRNDLSRIAQPHSVRVPALFHTEALPTVWQMTSDVQARTRAGTRLPTCLRRCSPAARSPARPRCGHADDRPLESAPRGVYCGAVGVVRPAGVAGPAACTRGTFNVPIRTVVLRAADGGPLRHRQRHHLGRHGRRRMARVAPQARLCRARQRAV
jgi:para-aminobenzoate synthetase/4-amino-4-deoxychorismate lyase